MIISYVKAGVSTRQAKQQAAVMAVAALHGLDIDKPILDETTTSTLLDGLISRLGPSDTIIVPSLNTLSEVPSHLLEIASSIAGRGARLLVADMGEPDLATMRTYAKTFEPLERDLNAARGKLAAAEARHSEEVDQFRQDWERMIFDRLQSLGIDFSRLMGGDAATADLKRPDIGRRLRRMREGLGLTQEQAGALLDPALNKGSVSKLENDGKGSRIDELTGALEAARVMHEINKRSESNAN